MISTASTYWKMHLLPPFMVPVPLPVSSWLPPRAARVQTRHRRQLSLMTDIMVSRSWRACLSLWMPTSLWITVLPDIPRSMVRTTMVQAARVLMLKDIHITSSRIPTWILPSLPAREQPATKIPNFMNWWWIQVSTVTTGRRWLPALPPSRTTLSVLPVLQTRSTTV